MADHERTVAPINVPPPPPPALRERVFVDKESDELYDRRIRSQALAQAVFATEIEGETLRARGNWTLLGDTLDRKVLDRAALFETYLRSGYSAARGEVGRSGGGQ